MEEIIQLEKRKEKEKGKNQQQGIIKKFGVVMKIA